ncbi:MAG: hypothetical protein FD143_2901 [Ignavibacteria bacterium]|nr:MAG: hypothetical protein FD143_2901 [Ignavibacteria bacterium]
MVVFISFFGGLIGGFRLFCCFSFLGWLEFVVYPIFPFLGPWVLGISVYINKVKPFFSINVMFLVCCLGVY